MKTCIYTTLIRWMKENNLYDKNDFGQYYNLKQIYKLQKINDTRATLCRIKSYLHKEYLPFEDYMFKQLTNKTKQDIFYDFLRDRNLTESFYR